MGLYTASAILSIAYGRPLPVVDGNVRRVLARLFALRGPEWRKDAPFYNLAEQILDRDRPGDWNQALMELGATVCAPRAARVRGLSPARRRAAPSPSRWCTSFPRAAPAARAST